MSKPRAGTRVSIRLDDEEQAMLRRARATTGKNTSGVIKAALRLYARALPAQTPLEPFEQCGVVGALAGPTELSSRYQAQLVP